VRGCDEIPVIADLPADQALPNLWAWFEPMYAAASVDCWNHRDTWLATYKLTEMEAAPRI